MRSIRAKVEEEMRRGDIGSDTGCPYHPSHYRGQNCSFCYCPFYPCGDADFGRRIASKRGGEVWDCSTCLFVHRNDVVAHLFRRFGELGVSGPDDPRLPGLLAEAKALFHRRGRAVMVLGATSDAGKSTVAAAICRVLSRLGRTAVPFKPQNMSLNSRAIRGGFEIAMAQELQCRAAGVTSPGPDVNPILLKPIGDSRSQVVVRGRPFGEYGAEEYYSSFVPEHGFRIVRESADFLLGRYDFVVMEGAGSPAEINLYGSDIANMRAAEIADAACILVVNVEWGGAFAYALGTLELLEERDRRRVKAILLNNLRGDAAGIMEGAAELERAAGVPVIGALPHLDLHLPKEDSECFRGMREQGRGRHVVAVVRLPRISNFTDVDPLLLEDVTLRFAESPEDLEGCAAVVIPGTKSTLSDYEWLVSAGLASAIASLRGRVPILGICGGYQMMGTAMRGPDGAGGGPAEVRGMGLLDAETSWTGRGKRVAQDRGILIPTGEPVSGYELHEGETVTAERPLFRIDAVSGSFEEGAFVEGERLYGTYLHGVFDMPGFRRYFLSQIDGYVQPDGPPPDYDAVIEESLDRLADAFEEAVDMRRFGELLLGGGP